MPYFEKMAQRFVSTERLARMEKVLEQRTRYVVPVFENLYKSHNAAAVIRTSEAFGVSRAHFIEGESEYQDHRDVTQGSHRWMDVITHPSTEDCFSFLRKEGYLIVGTCLHEQAVTPQELPVDRPVALVFGNELDGLSQATLENCDQLVTIPMFGFVESFNISVAAALLLSELLTRVRGDASILWALNKRERHKTRQRWLYRNTRIGKIIAAARRSGKSLN